MSIRTGLIAFALMFAAVLPAQAAFCVDDDSAVTLEFGLRFGAPYTEQERNDLDLMRLRQDGVDATRVERWNGCIRAFVRKPEGGEEMQFFDPNNYRRVQ